MKYILTLLCLVFLVTPYSYSSNIDKGEYTFFETKAKGGDGVFSILRRYSLSQYACNIDQFYKINSLKKDAFLKVGKKYKLPVMVYKYNGRSIRSTIKIDDWDLALRIKAYNDALQQKGLRKQTYDKSGVLWVPFHELHCDDVIDKNESIEPVKKKLTFSDNLFGEKYKEVTLIDESLKGKVFYIVSGHGGNDPGATYDKYTKMLCEDEYAYDVSLRLIRNLKQRGATVVSVIHDDDGIRDEDFLGCDKDEVLANGQALPKAQRKRLYQRTDYINRRYKKYKKAGVSDQYLISIHVDSRSSDHEQDVFFCHYTQSKTGESLASSLKNTFAEKYELHRKNRGYKGFVQSRNLYVLMNSAPTAVLVELANIKNKKNHKRIMMHENRQALADWLFEGLAEYIMKKTSK